MTEKYEERVDALGQSLCALKDGTGIVTTGAKVEFYTQGAASRFSSH